jgi:hypothetical protein
MRTILLLSLAACATRVKALTPTAPVVTATIAAPEVPQALVATGADGSVTLTWSASANATSYAVLRAVDGKTFAALATTHAATYVDTAVVNARPYSYEVKASGAGGDSAFSAVVSATPLSAFDQWTVRHHSATLTSVAYGAYGAQTFVAVGHAGTLRYSHDDGATWTDVNAPTAADFSCVIYAAARGFIATSSDAVLTSPDGVTWTSHAPVHTDTIAQVLPNALDCNDARCVAISQSLAFTSSDLESWTSSTLPLRARDVAATDSGFVAGGENNSTTAMAFAADGASWSTTYSDSSFGVTRVLAQAGSFVAFATTSTGFSTLASSDGAHWQIAASSDCDGGGVTTAAAQGAQIFAVCDSRGVARLASGNAWTTPTQTLPIAAFFYGAAFGATHVALVGEAGAIVTAAGNVFATIAADASLTSVAFGSGVYAAVGSGGVLYTSSDAATWSQHSAPMRDPLERIIFGGGQFWSVGDEKIFSATDGVAWAAETTPLIYGRLHGVAASADGTVVAVGDYSATSATFAARASGVWTAYTAPALAALADVAYGNGQFVAVGSSGNILASATGADTASWQPQTSPVTTDLVRVIWNGAAFLALDAGGAVISSSDGITWSVSTLPPDSFSALGSDGTTTLVGGANALLLSTDTGGTWPQRYPATPSASDTITDLLFANGGWLLVGADALIMTKR